MNELIPINYDNDYPTVSGRDLHKALQVETRYNDWFARMCEFGFEEGKSYYSVLSNRLDGLPGKPRIDHILTIAMAKEICILQRSEMGKKFREYLLAVEQAWDSPDKLIERALVFAHKRVIESERKIFALSEKNDMLETALNDSLKYYTVAKYNKTFKMNWNLEQSQTIGKKLSAYCRSRAIKIRICNTNDERFGDVHSYPITAWEDFMEERTNA